MSATPEFATVFEQLKGIMHRHARRLTVVADAPGHYELNAGYSERFKRDLYFGGVTLRKSYVSYYLMPVYMFPELLDGISPELRRHMQGKSCFNFKTVDKALFAELGRLTKQSLERCRQEKLLKSAGA